MPPIEPHVLILLICLGAGYESYEHAVKPAAICVTHTVKAGATKIGHGLKWLVHR